MKKHLLPAGGALVSLSLVLSLCQTANAECVHTQDGSPYKTSVGCGALQHNSTGSWNSALGIYALQYNTTGGNNTAVGAEALLNNTTGSYNTAAGFSSLAANTTGTRNSAFGFQALRFNTGPASGATGDAANAGSSNTAVGFSALTNNTTGWQNTAVGESALLKNTTGAHNTGIGEDALNLNTTGIANTAVGESALYDNSTGNYNVANGYYALNKSTGTGNVAVGYQAALNLTGANNVAIGYQAGVALTTGDYNLTIANDGVADDSNTIRIGTPGSSATGTTTGQNRTFIAGIQGRQITGLAVSINSNGQLGTTSSSRRFKKDIETLGSMDDKVLTLRPVSFRYKQADEHGGYPLQYGLIAEEVAEIFPELVQYDAEGKPFSVYYQFLPPLLLAEVQRQHAANDMLRAEVATLRQQTQAQSARLAAIEEKLASLKGMTRADAR